MTTDLPATQNRRVELLNKFFERYNFQIPLENQPSDPALLLVIKAHQRKSCEFIPLSKITNAVDGRDLKIDNTRVKLNAELTLDLGTTSKKRTSDFQNSPETFVHAVRVLMISYALVSVTDPIEDTWCSYNAAQQHISTVETFSRASSKANFSMFSRVMDAEMSVRSEWTRVSQAESSLSLSQIIATVAQRYTLWPALHEFRSLGKGFRSNQNLSQHEGKGAGKKKPWTREQRNLYNKKMELKFQQECVMEAQLCNNHQRQKCKITFPSYPPSFPGPIPNSYLPPTP